MDTGKNHSGSHYFYEKLGFVRTGKITGEVNGEVIIEYERVK